MHKNSKILIELEDLVSLAPFRLIHVSTGKSV